MKTILKPALLAMTAIFLAAGTEAAVFSDLHIFSGNDGAWPSAGLVLSGHTLYGTTWAGGINGSGTVFAVNVDGTGFTNIYNFPGKYAQFYGGLVLSGNTLYGTMAYGTNGFGTVFAINTDGTGFTNLHYFGNIDGAYPESTLTLSGSTLYGTTYGGGSGGYGTVFAINTDGTDFTNLYNLYFDSNVYHRQPGLALSGNTLYGTTMYYGINNDGGIFAVNTDGTGFTNLYSFTAFIQGSSLGLGLYSWTNSDGDYPLSVLVVSSNTLYGTAEGGGSEGFGTVFAINTDGSGFTNLYNFTATAGILGSTNSDGATPSAGLILSGNILYGTTYGGGSGGYGTVFAINTDGTGFTNLYSFSAGTWFMNSQTSDANTINSDGAQLIASLILSDNTLYGTTYSGGTNGDGTVFALSLGPIPLNIQTISNAVVLNWGNPAFSLQAATNVSGIYANVPGATSPCTNIITGSQQFFRLQAN
jgi:uncharacterized repeat protein (TIGR03803 family)